MTSPSNESFPGSFPWHPDIVNPREAIPPTQAELVELRNTTAEIADAIATVGLPWPDDFLRMEPNLRLIVGRENSQESTPGRLFITYTELPLTLDSARTCYRINESETGLVSLALDQGSIWDATIFASLDEVVTGGQQFVENALQKSEANMRDGAELEAFVSALAGPRISAAEVDRIVGDLTTSWAVRRVELGL